MMEMYGYDGLSLAIPSAQYSFVGPDLSLTDLHQVRKSSSSGKFSQPKATTLVVTFLPLTVLVHSLPAMDVAPGNSHS